MNPLAKWRIDLSRADLNLLVWFEVVLEERHVGLGGPRGARNAHGVRMVYSRRPCCRSSARRVGRGLGAHQRRRAAARRSPAFQKQFMQSFMQAGIK
jgi:hypothetical protein